MMEEILYDTTIQNAASQQPTQSDEVLQERNTEAQTGDSGSKPDVSVAPVQHDVEKSENFRAIRQAAQKAARERDEALERLAQYERQGQSSRAPVQEDQESDLDLNIKDDELAEGKHLQKLKTTIKRLEAKQKQIEEMSYTNSAESRLRTKYNDFDKVMTLDNIKTFSAAYPELAESINSSQDLYSKAVSAYTLIKRFGIYDDQPYEAEKVRAVANTAKPRPLTSVGAQQGDSPLSRANAFANGLTDELKKQLREEMAAASRKY